LFLPSLKLLLFLSAFADNCRHEINKIFSGRICLLAEKLKVKFWKTSKNGLDDIFQIIIFAVSQ